MMHRLWNRSFGSFARLLPITNTRKMSLIQKATLTGRHRTRDPRIGLSPILRAFGPISRSDTEQTCLDQRGGLQKHESNKHRGDAVQAGHTSIKPARDFVVAL